MASGDIFSAVMVPDPNTGGMMNYRDYFDRYLKAANNMPKVDREGIVSGTAANPYDSSNQRKPTTQPNVDIDSRSMFLGSSNDMEVDSDELNQAYNDSLIEQMYGGDNPQGVTGGVGASMEGTGSDAGSSFGSIDWGDFIRRLLTGAASAAGSGAGGGLANPAGLAGGAMMAKLLYERFKALEEKAEALRNQAQYTPAPLYSRQLQSPIYGRGGIGEALYFNPIPFQYNAEQARQQSNMAVPQDASRPKPTMPAYTTTPTTPREQPQYISNLLSSFQSPVSFAPNLTGNTRMPTMQESVAPYVVSRAEGGPIYDMPDESLGYARGGIAGMLNGPGDGMSDHIPATIQGKQPARLSDGEFVVPADVVSHLGNGSSKAGAEHLYNMMDKIRKDRTGRTEQAKQINPNKYLRG